MVNLFTKHPKSVNETYWQHMCAACKFSARIFLAGSACLLHAVFPFLCETTGSDIIEKLCKEMCERVSKSQ